MARKANKKNLWLCSAFFLCQLLQESKKPSPGPDG